MAARLSRHTLEGLGLAEGMSTEPAGGSGSCSGCSACGLTRLSRCLSFLPCAQPSFRASVTCVHVILSHRMINSEQGNQCTGFHGALEPTCCTAQLSIFAVNL